MKPLCLNCATNFLSPTSGRPPVAANTFDAIDPSTEQVLASVARGGPEDIDDAVAAARAAFEGPWRRVTPVERGRLLYRVARELEARIVEFAELETLDTGKPLAHAHGEISGCVGYLDYYAGAADKIHGETVPLGPDYLNYTVREPLGVTAHIVPWNMPLSHDLPQPRPRPGSGQHRRYQAGGTDAPDRAQVRRDIPGSELPPASTT